MEANQIRSWCCDMKVLIFNRGVMFIYNELDPDTVIECHMGLDLITRMKR